MAMDGAVAGRREYEKKVMLAETSYPFRVVFDSPLARVREMGADADAQHSVRGITCERVSCYFKSFDRLHHFVERWGPGRQMTDFESDQLATQHYGIFRT